MSELEAIGGLITASEGRVREDITKLDTKVDKLDTRVGAIEAARQLSEQRKSDWFQARGSFKALVVTIIAVGSLALGFLNAIG